MKIFKPTAIAACIVLSILACNNASDKHQSKNELSKTKNLSLTEMKPAESPQQEPPALESTKFTPPKIVRDEEEKINLIIDKEQEPEQSWKNFQTDTSQSPGQTQKTLPATKNNPASTPDWNKKIIKNASLNLEVKEYKVFNASVRDKTKQLGGYIAMEEQNQSEYKIENIMTIKVPVDQFDNAVSLFTIDAEKLIEKKITSEDVTSEVVDTKSRLEAKKQVRLRYLDLLKQAKNMEEILNVQQEINEIQEDIESAAGRIQYLGNASSYSTISLTYFQVLNPSAKNIDEPGFAKKLWGSFRNGWEWMGEVLIGVISVWPLFLVVFACWILYRKTRIAKIKNA